MKVVLILDVKNISMMTSSIVVMPRANICMQSIRQEPVQSAFISGVGPIALSPCFGGNLHN